MHTSELMARIHTCSREGGISPQRRACPRGRRASILYLEEKPRAGPPRRHSRRNRKRVRLLRARPLLVISKQEEGDENIAASWIIYLSPVGRSPVRLLDTRAGMDGASRKVISDQVNTSGHRRSVSTVRIA